METKHTPGPWRVTFRDEDDGTALIEAEGGWCVCESARGLPGGMEETRANERLICAAPELLEALRDLSGLVQFLADQLDSEPGNQISVAVWLSKLAAAKAAIAKAEPQQSPQE